MTKVFVSTLLVAGVAAMFSTPSHAYEGSLNGWAAGYAQAYNNEASAKGSGAATAMFSPDATMPKVPATPTAPKQTAKAPESKAAPTNTADAGKAEAAKQTSTTQQAAMASANAAIGAGATIGVGAANMAIASTAHTAGKMILEGRAIADKVSAQGKATMADSKAVLADMADSAKISVRGDSTMNASMDKGMSANGALTVVADVALSRPTTLDRVSLDRPLLDRGGLLDRPMRLFERPERAGKAM